MENVRGEVTFQGRLSKLQEPSCMVATSFISEFPWPWLFTLLWEYLKSRFKSINPKIQFIKFLKNMVIVCC